MGFEGNGMVPASLSGNERNRLFLARRGEQFNDISGISGLDHAGDSRAFALLDYDRDGRLDVVSVNANAPFLQLFRNQIGGEADPVGGRVIAIRFVGGNHSSAPVPAWSNRNGFGARVTIASAGLTLTREHRAGEGLAAQNSTTMLVGLGAGSPVSTLTVRWPSGRVQTVEGVTTGSLVTVYENPAQAPDGAPFRVEPYHVAPKAPALPHRLTSMRYPDDRLELEVTLPESTLRMYTTMATWCPFCKFWQPQVHNVVDAFDRDALRAYGVPIDPQDTPEMLDAYVQEYRPAYTLLTDVEPPAVDAVQEMARRLFRADALPISVVTDVDGHVLLTVEGVPAISDIRRLLFEQRATSGRFPRSD